MNHGEEPKHTFNTSVFRRSACSNASFDDPLMVISTGRNIQMGNCVNRWGFAISSSESDLLELAEIEFFSQQIFADFNTIKVVASGIKNSYYYNAEKDHKGAVTGFTTDIQ
ncbi:hypothetical protein CDAR_618471 [Caerostris darwini]|uniref:Uncharacterized protein n=1 Tax=Caerostris darwini TaxID=1538125 RepID=A0AAV4SZ53_9ARAC|nr:hypothetical protein CDAR_618471 [Caerostris darwini]